MGLNLIAGMRREIRRMGSRKMYLGGYLVPVVFMVFFLILLSQGLPNRVPTAVVDYDNSEMSRALIRNLNTEQQLEIIEHATTYDEAMAQVRRGTIFGFFVIPPNFQKETLRGDKPTLEFYSNLTYFIPGTLAFKGFKTAAVVTAGGVVKSVLEATGIEGAMSTPSMTFDQFPLHTPWANYAYYMAPSFAFGLLGLMVLLMTIFSITIEIKEGTSPQWLERSNGHISMALLTKMIPHTVVWSAIGLLMVWMMFGYSHFPLAGSLGWICVATVLMVVAYQCFGIFISSILPNPRLAFSLGALFGILTFSFAGFSFPVQSMYGAIAIFSYAAPVRYWFLIYLNEGLNGYPVFYSRFYFAALLGFMFLYGLAMKKLRKACINPVYVP